MTNSKTNDQAALKLHDAKLGIANKYPTLSKTFEEAYAITSTVLKSIHSNLNHLKSKRNILSQENINKDKTMLTFLDNGKLVKQIFLQQKFF